jgi:hypothetical protein
LQQKDSDHHYRDVRERDASYSTSRHTTRISFVSYTVHIIHFTRRNENGGHEGPELQFQGQDITASADVKLLWVTLDSKMKFQQHVATVTARATRQCLAIRCLQGSGQSKSDNCITPQLHRSWTTALPRGMDRRNRARSLFFATWRGYNVSEHRL